jgi:hypothetical protein
MPMKRMSGRVTRRQCNTENTVEEDTGKPGGLLPRDKNKYNLCVDRSQLSEIKLKRTDTTLDLSQ